MPQTETETNGVLRYWPLLEQSKSEWLFFTCQFNVCVLSQSQVKFCFVVTLQRSYRDWNETTPQLWWTTLIRFWNNMNSRNCTASNLVDTNCISIHLLISTANRISLLALIWAILAMCQRAQQLSFVVSTSSIPLILL